MWNIAQTAELTKLWNEGASAGIIARTLKKGATRSSVIGKVKRLGLKGRGGMVRNSERIAAFQQPSMPLQFKPKITQGPIPDKLISRPKINAKPLPLPPDLPVPDGSKTFMEVGPIGRECRYPYGDPHDLSTFRFCAKPAHGSWCSEHNIWERR